MIYGSSKIPLCTLVDFLCLSKTTAAEKNPAKSEVRPVVRVFTAKHFSAVANHWEIFTVYGLKQPHLVMSKEFLCDFNYKKMA